MQPLADATKLEVKVSNVLVNRGETELKTMLRLAGGADNGTARGNLDHRIPRSNHR